MSVKNLLLFFLLLWAFPSAAQSRIVKGIVCDGQGNGIPYAIVALGDRTTAAVCNEAGEFILPIPDKSESDSIFAGAFGCEQRGFAVDLYSSPVCLTLSADAFTLDEVVVTPRSPAEYIRMAARAMTINCPARPYGTLAYYCERLKENGHFVRADEGVFRSFISGEADSSSGSHQLLLYRLRENVCDIQFMKRKLERDEPADTTLQSLGFGGPGAILQTGDFSNSSWSFLDTNKIGEYSYHMEPSTVFSGREQMVIGFSAKNKVDHIRESGKIYLDVATFAVTRVEDAGTFVVPLHIKALLFVYGIRIRQADFERSVDRQYVDGTWYPRRIRYEVDLHVKKRNLFSADDESEFDIGQVYDVTRLETRRPVPVKQPHLFDASKKMALQAHNDAGVSWPETISAR